MTTTTVFRPTGDAAYDALRIKYDWHSKTPPPNYRIGFGRGARGFVTSAETTTQIRAPVVAADLEFLNETDRVEEAIRNQSRRQKKREREKEDVQSPSSSTTATQSRVKLTEADLLTISNGLEVAPIGHVRSSSRQDLPNDPVQSQLFSTDVDIRLPMQQFSEQVLSSAAVSADMLSKTELDAVLKFGSEDDQKTWITRSRIQMQLGHRKQALRELESGCRRAGKQGAAIWLERMSLLKDRPEDLRVIAEEATKEYPHSETLWVTAIELQPYHLQLDWVMKALLQLPSSQKLWLVLLEQVPDEKERKQIIRRCLETNERERSGADLSRLWGMLAALEPVEKGRELLRLVKQKRAPPPLSILLEVAWFEETDWRRRVASVSQKNGQDEDFTACMRAACGVDLFHSDLVSIQRVILREAALLWLNASDKTSRATWLSAIRTSLQDRRCPVTAALMTMSLGLPKSQLAAALPPRCDSVVTTWLSDVCNLFFEHVSAWNARSTYSSTHLAVAGGTCDKEYRLLVVLWLCQWTLLHASGVLHDMGTFSWLIAMVLHACSESELQVDFSSSSTSHHHVELASKDDEEEEEFLQRKPAPTTTASTHSFRSVGGIAVLVERTVSLLDGHEGFVDILVAIAQALFRRQQIEFAHLLLSKYASHDDRAVIALARLEQQRSGDLAAEEVLARQCAIASATPYCWKKLLVHLRATGRLTPKACEEATSRFPSDRSLRLIAVRFQCDVYVALLLQQKLETSQIHTDAIRAATSILRDTYRLALAPDVPSCRSDPVVWAYLARRVEGETLNDPAAARRLITEAMEEFGPKRVVRNGIAHFTPMDRMMVASLEPLLAAAIRIEQRFGDDGAALQTLKGALDQMPVELRPDQLVGRMIELTPRGSRGAAAGIVMRLTPNPGPLTRLAVAKIYHAMKQHQKATKLVCDAVQLAPRCGDGYAMLIALLVRDPDHYTELLQATTLFPVVAVKSASGGDSTATTVATTTTTAAATAASDLIASIVEHAAGRSLNSGPLWLDMAKEIDPRNVTLNGYRDAVQSMLESCAAAVQL